MVACSNNVFINQFRIRTTSISGAFNLLFTFLYQLLIQGKLIESWRELKSSPDCLSEGYHLGMIQTELFRYTASKEILYGMIEDYNDPEQKHRYPKFEDDTTTA
jgi:hypothetical protein